MKKFTWLLFLIPLLCQAQVYRDVTRTVSGVTTVYTVLRDTTVYHLNPAGDAALTAAIRAGTIPLLSPARSSQSIGTFNYKPTGLTGTDYTGQAFIATAAPTLVTANRTVPRTLGNYFSFSPQQAKQVGLLRRLPAFSLHPSKLVVYAGPNFSTATDRVQLSRGFTDLDDCVQGRTLINSNRYVPLIQGGYAGLAATAAAPLPDGDARKTALLAWANGKTFITNVEAARLFGRAIYADIYSKAGGGNPTGYSCDFEDGQAASGQDFFVSWSSMVGNVMQGVKDAAVDAGRPVPIPIAYDFSAITPYSLFQSQADQNGDGTVNDGVNGVTGLDSPEAGIPYYFHYKSLYFTWAGGSKAAPLGTGTAISAYARTNPTAFGQNEYANAPWDEQSLWQKNGDGSFKTRTVGGKTLLTIRTDQRTATLYGVSVPILSDDAYQYLYKGRERIQQAVVDMYWRAGGKHLPLSTDRQAGWENLKLMQYFRFDAEFKGRDQQGQDGEVLNRRPLNADFLERDVLVHSLLRDVIRVFGENGPMIQQGVSGVVSTNGYNTFDPLKSKGPVEVFTKALYRASQFNYLGDTPWQLVCPRYYVHRGREDQSTFLPQDQPEKNPIILGGIVPAAPGGAKLWLLWSYDCQDVNQNSDLYFWYKKDDGSTSTNSYKVQFQGRRTGLEDVLLPSGFAGIAPKNIRFRFVDMTGETQTLTGDYRITGNNSETQPPVLLAGSTTIPPSNTVTSPGSTTAPAWVAGLRYNYTSPTLTIEGAGQIGQIKFEHVDNSPFTTTNPDNVTINSGTFYGYGTQSGQGIFDRKWAIYAGLVPFRITLNKEGEPSTTFTTSFTPVAGAYHVTLATATTVTTPGSSTATGTDADGFLTYTDQGWSGNALKYIENTTMKVGFGPEGGIVRYAALKSDNQNRVNDYIITHPVTGQQVPDLGRQWMEFSSYMTPGNGYVQNGKNTAVGYQGNVFDTGDNVVQGGSLYPALDKSLVIKSAIVNTQDRGQVMCFSVRPRLWGVKDEFGHFTGDYEGWLDGNALLWKARHNIEARPAGSSPPVYQSREQENPCLYVLAPFTTHLAKVGGSVVNRFPSNWQGGNPFSNTVYTDECWIGAYPGSSGSGVTYYSPYNSAVRSGQFTDVFGVASSNAASYLNAALSMNYDNVGSYVTPLNAVILGTNSEALTKIASLPAINQSFDFEFTTSNHRWNNRDCRAIRSGTQYKVYIGDVNQDNSSVGLFSSPARAWQASAITNIEITAEVANVTKLWLYWHKPGEENDDSKVYRKIITLGNGVTTISTSDPNWNGIISWVGIRAIRNGDPDQNGNPATPSNAYIIPIRIRKTP